MAWAQPAARAPLPRRTVAAPSTVASKVLPSCRSRGERGCVLCWSACLRRGCCAGERSAGASHKTRAPGWTCQAQLTPHGAAQHTTR